jgi:hypothetical protein
VTASFRTEFPGFPPGAYPNLPESFEDSSWHNDSCPSMSSGGLGLLVYVDYPDPADREDRSLTRYSVIATVGGEVTYPPVLETDLWADVMDLVERSGRDG